MPRIALVQQIASDNPASNLELGLSNARKAAADGAPDYRLS